MKSAQIWLRACATALAIGHPAANSAMYHLVDLGKFEPFAINADEVISGRVTDVGWIPARRIGDTVQRLHSDRGEGFVGGTTVAVNDQGDVVGELYDGRSGEVPALWMSGTKKVTRLPLPPTVHFAFATGIARGGRIVGYADPETGDCLSWNVMRSVSQFAPPGNWSQCSANAINNEGNVALTVIGDGQVLGYVLRGGVYMNIGSLGGETQASAINQLGHVAGWSKDSQGIEHGILWKDGTLVDLGSVGSDGGATALNDVDTVVGSVFGVENGRFSAVIFINGEAVLLQTLVDDPGDWQLEMATGVANNGTIVGYGVRKDGSQHGFKLVPQDSH
jgi:probable HAF family extracellular repeat protein